ncbi:aspartate/glutamate racemase family protein [Sporolactobacillus sp. Y61]|uniref:Aspartate/glutamate racemase family protein n=1 Tax=Sporolactobacillus sp. Y61 TaxID=3160863 RepID=A0AAU8IJ26_9BACL
MKTIGLIGGMSWESTAHYYEKINQEIKKRMGGLHSAKIILNSLDFAPIAEWQENNQWEQVAGAVISAAQSLERAGADFIIICSNTGHKVAQQVSASVSIPFLHIAQAASDKIKENQLTKVGLLGTRYTMEQDFYKDVLKKNGIEVMIPDSEERKRLNNIIFNELCLGKINKRSSDFLEHVIENLINHGCQGIVLGCTELDMLIPDDEVSGVPVFDTTKIHVEAAVLQALKQQVR